MLFGETQVTSVTSLGQAVSLQVTHMGFVGSFLAFLEHGFWRMVESMMPLEIGELHRM